MENKKEFVFKENTRVQDISERVLLIGREVGNTTCVNPSHIEMFKKEEKGNILEIYLSSGIKLKLPYSEKTLMENDSKIVHNVINFINSTVDERKKG